MPDVTTDPSGTESPATPAVQVAPEPGPTSQTSPTPPPPATAPAVSRSEQRRRRRNGVPWKTVGTVALLCVLAAAVTVVLLQSAGVISWGFLGPTA